MCGEKAARQLNLVPLSNDTVSRGIDNMADDVKNILVERIKRSRYYSIQPEDTTDVANLANLLVYVRYEYNGASHEDFVLSDTGNENYCRGHISVREYFYLRKSSRLEKVCWSFHRWRQGHEQSPQQVATRCAGGSQDAMDPLQHSSRSPSNEENACKFKVGVGLSCKNGELHQGTANAFPSLWCAL